MKAERFPFDFDAMQKGDYVPAERIEKMVGVPRNHADYALKLLGIKAMIESELHSRGKVYTVRSERGGVRVMDDAGASRHNHKDVGRGVRKIMRAQFRNLAVDNSALTDDQKRDHLRYLEVDGKMVQAIASTRPRLVPMAVRRQVPGLMSS